VIGSVYASVYASRLTATMPASVPAAQPHLTDTEGITAMAGPISRHRDVESLKTAASWPGADRNTTVILALRLAAARADADGYRYFSGLAGDQPGQALPLAIAGFFQARLGEDVDAALAKLDQAAAADLGPPQYFRGLALAGLPPDRRRAEQAVADLGFVLAVADQFPAMLLRAAYHGLAAAHAVLGQHDQAAEAERKSGLSAAPADTQLMFGGFWATAADGFRFASPRILRPEPGIQVAQGYDFCDLAFITTSDGVVAIDAGTTQDRVKAALSDLDLPADAAISHLILTHAHWDHVGGAGALAGPGTRVIAQGGFPAGLDRQQGDRPRFRYFTGAAGGAPPAVVPDQLISDPTPLTIGGTELVLYPTPGGETPDALMVHLPASGVLFTGDVLMPYLGQPFAAEGSPEGLLETLAFIASLRPRLLIQGHTTLTELFTAGAVPGLQAALTQLHGEVLDGIRGGRTLPDILEQASLPAVLREHPAAVVPYLVIRDHFTERLYHQRTGYWQPDGTGLEPATAAGHAAALDLLAGGREEQFAAAAASLIGQGDHALALQIIQPGLLCHPASPTLAGLRTTALHRLMEQHQQLDPFKFLIYAELAGAELGPVE
jgi:glyoxylase-like metal-dependent hydrolase (beta-lactamase superfamily II)